MPLKLEFKRSLNNKSFLFCFLTVLLSFVLGYILLISIDKIENVTIQQLFFSVYTVFTQLGMMIFSIIIIYFINSDYKEKNILFYKILGVNAKSYFLSKVIILILWYSISIILISTIVCFFYKNFSYLFIMINYLENSIIYIILIVSMFSFLFKNMLVVFCTNFFVWIMSIVTLTVFPNFKYIAYFDASNEVYNILEKYLEVGKTNWSTINLLLYNLIIFIIVFLVITIFSKRWTKNGV